MSQNFDAFSQLFNLLGFELELLLESSGAKGRMNGHCFSLIVLGFVVVSLLDGVLDLRVHHFDLVFEHVQVRLELKDKLTICLLCCPNLWRNLGAAGSPVLRRLRFAQRLSFWSLRLLRTGLTSSLGESLLLECRLRVRRAVVGLHFPGCW